MNPFTLDDSVQPDVDADLSKNPPVPPVIAQGFTVAPKPQPAAIPPDVAQFIKAQAPASPDYNAQAANILGPAAGDRMALAKHLVHPTMGQSIGDAFAGLGDSIAKAAGGSSNHLGEAVEQQKDKASMLLDSADKDVALNKDKFSLAQQLQEKDPNSPLSKAAQQMYGPLLQKLGLDASKMSAGNIAEITGKGVDTFKAQSEANLAAETQRLRLQQLATEAKREAEEERFHRDETKHNEDVLNQTTQNQAKERELAAKQQKSKDAAEVLKDESKWNPFNHGDRAAALKTLNDNIAEPSFTPDVLSYAQTHGITPDQALQIKLARTGGK